MTEQQEPNQQALAVEDRDFAATELDVLREQLAELRAERDERAARVEKLAAELESWGGSMASTLAKALRAALRGDVPA